MLNKLKKNKKGFTLIEIIVVLVILAILIGALTPTMIGFINDARGKAMVAEAREGVLAAQLVYMENNATAPADLATAVGTAVTNAKFLQLVADVMILPGTPTYSGITFDAQGHVTGLTYARNGRTVTINSGVVTVT